MRQIEAARARGRAPAMFGRRFLFGRQQAAQARGAATLHTFRKTGWTPDFHYRSGYSAQALLPYSLRYPTD
jgi:hypothetical protein